MKYQKVPGARTGNLIGYRCPRCQEGFGIVDMDMNGALYFCANDECINDDWKSSLPGNASNSIRDEKDCSSMFGVGSRYIHASLSRWLASDENQAKVNKWLKSPKSMLIMMSDPGKGKTYFCCAAANYILSTTSKSLKYTNVRKFHEELQDAIGKNHSQFKAIKKFADYDFLILDDLGASTCTEWQQEVTLDLIDQRYSGLKPTIVTTNLSWDEIKNKLGARTERRLNNEENEIIIL